MELTAGTLGWKQGDLSPPNGRFNQTRDGFQILKDIGNAGRDAEKAEACV